MSAEATTPTETTNKGRSSQFAGMTIIRNYEANPRRAGSIGHASYEMITDGMSYEDYIKAGGRGADILYGVKKGHLTLLLSC